MNEVVVRGLVIGLFLWALVSVIGAVRKKLKADPERARRAGIFGKVLGLGLLAFLIMTAHPADRGFIVIVAAVVCGLWWVFKKPASRSERGE